MTLLKEGKTNLKYILIIVILAAIVGGGILAWQYLLVPKEEPKLPEVKPPEVKAPEEMEAPEEIKPIKNKVDAANIIQLLLGAKKIFIHSEMVKGDINNDGQEDIVVFATIVGGVRPMNAGGEWEYEGQETSSDLMIISKEENMYGFKAYFINAFGISTAPYISLRDFNNDKKFEIILSTSDLAYQSDVSSSKIYKLEEDKLVLIQFKGGEFDGTAVYYGALKLSEENPSQVIILYGKDGGVSDTYVWNKAGFFEFLSTTSRKPSELEQMVINHLDVNINDIVKAKPVLGATKFFIRAIQFYPDNKFITSFDDGHILGYLFGKYILEGDQVRIEYIDETFDLEKLDELKIKYQFPVDEAINYLRSEQVSFEWKWTPVDLLTP